MSTPWQPFNATCLHYPKDLELMFNWQSSTPVCLRHERLQ